MELPPGFPISLDLPMAWLPKDIDEGNYVEQLTDGDLKELERALASFKGFGLGGEEVSRSRFPLPTLQRRLESCSRELHQGIGFFVLRGLDPNQYSPEDRVILFLGIADYIGELRGRQDRQNNVLAHITDRSRRYVNEARRDIHSSGEIGFHTEIVTDILALYVVQTASHGGETLVSPTWSIYNELAATRPDVLWTLSRSDWPSQILRKPSNAHRPLLFHKDGRLIFSMDQGPLQKSPDDSTPGVAKLTKEQFESLKLVQSLAKKYQREIVTEPGDILFINNFGVMHSRRAYKDGAMKQRHLIRLWLRNDELGWTIPEELKSSWDVVFKPASRSDDFLFPIEPKPYYKAPKISSGTGNAFFELSDQSDDDSA